MTQSYVERELKFDVAPGFVVPDVSPLLPSGGRTEVVAEQLRSDYFDTVDYALLRARVVLRRRVGTTDTGWQLKIPDGAFRTEIRVDDPDGERVPDALEALLVGVGRRQPLHQVATVTTQRSATHLVDGDGQLLAEIDDDLVHSVAPGASARLSSWREVEVELGDADFKVLYELGKRLRHAGARPSRSSSKLARALPDVVARHRLGKSSRAGEVLNVYLVEQQRVILNGDVALRRGEDGAVHKTRVATRRFRSTLRVFGECFDPDRAGALDNELRWYAALLGEVRDRQVLRKRLDAMLDDIEDTVTFGPVRTRIDSALLDEQAEHWQRLVTELNGDRYLSLLAEIDGWIRRLPQTSSARRPSDTITKQLRKAERTTIKRLRAATRASDVAMLHRARKAAKRARYAAEAAEPVIGKRAAKHRVRRYRKLQDLLGEHQDSIVSVELIRRLGAKAGTAAGENGFTYGILHEREQHNARVSRTKARHAAKHYRT